jgi:hypothetical protein
MLPTLPTRPVRISHLLGYRVHYRIDAKYTAVKRSWLALVLVYLSIGGALLLLLVYPRLPKV